MDDADSLDVPIEPRVAQTTRQQNALLSAQRTAHSAQRRGRERVLWSIILWLIKADWIHSVKAATHPVSELGHVDFVGFANSIPSSAAPVIDVPTAFAQVC